MDRAPRPPAGWWDRPGQILLLIAIILQRECGRHDLTIVLWQAGRLWIGLRLRGVVIHRVVDIVPGIKVRVGIIIGHPLVSVTVTVTYRNYRALQVDIRSEQGFYRKPIGRFNPLIVVSERGFYVYTPAADSQCGRGPSEPPGARSRSLILERRRQCPHWRHHWPHLHLPHLAHLAKPERQRGSRRQCGGGGYVAGGRPSPAASAMRISSSSGTG